VGGHAGRGDPTGRHTGAPSRAERVTTCSDAPPVPAVTRRTATSWPSGDHSGWKSSAPAGVPSARLSLPSARIVQSVLPSYEVTV
jgi:hypothetical protein